MNIKRPKRINEEDEDALMEIQQEFLKQKVQPSVKLVKKQADESPAKTVEKSTGHDVFDMDHTTIQGIMFDIQERDTSKCNHEPPVYKQLPIVEKIELSKASQAKKSTKSLFAQRLEKSGSLKAYCELKTRFEDDTGKVQHKQQIITGEGLTGHNDAERIHLENLEILSKMNKDEILNEQKKLLDSLDPKIISFIRKRGLERKTAVSMATDNNTDGQTTEPGGTTNQLVLNIKHTGNKWLNMDKIEYDKLEWMSDVPAVCGDDDSKISHNQYMMTARFDFNGNLIDQSGDISYRLGLHHHGNEPDLAGYSIDELFHLTRSNFEQQRTLALQILASILYNVQMGRFHKKLKDPLLPQLIDNGIVFVLRFALDSQVETIISSALGGFVSIMQPVWQETVLDKCFNLYNGHACSPSMYPSVRRTMSHDDMKQLNDLEFIKIDVVKGLFRMDLIDRFVYLIMSYKFCSADKPHGFIFDILFRMLRHSAESCYEIYDKYGPLVDFVITELLFNEENGAERRRQLAFKFVRLLCQSSRSISMAIYSKYDFKTTITRSIANDDHSTVKIEALKLLKVFTIFGLTSDLLTDAYELLIKDVRRLIVADEKTDDLFGSYMSLFECLCRLTHVDDRFETIRYGLCATIASLVITYLKGILINGADHRIHYKATCFLFLASFVFGFESSKVDLFKRAEQIQHCYNEIVATILNNTGGLLDRILSKLKTCSFLVSSSFGLDALVPNNLNCLPTLLIPAEYASCDEAVHLFNWLIGYVRLLNGCLRSKRDLDVGFKDTKSFLSNSNLRSYLTTAFYNCTTTMANSEDFYLVKYEIYFVYNYLKLVAFVSNFDEKAFCEADCKFYNTIGLNLVGMFKTGDEFYIHDLACSFLFDLNMWAHLTKLDDGDSTRKNDVVQRLQNLRLTPDVHTINEQWDSSCLTDQLENIQAVFYNSINLIKSSYLADLQVNLEKSKQLNQLDSGIPETLIRSRYKETFILNRDWIFNPIRTALSNTSQASVQTRTSLVLYSLEFLLNCELHRPKFACNIPISIKYTRLLGIFMGEHELYKDANVSFYLYLLLKHFVQDTKQIDQCDFGIQIPGIISFYDYYKYALETYESTSYGNRLYTLFILVPIQQHCPQMYRQLLWSDFVHIFRFCQVGSIQHMPFKYDAFLRPYELNVNILSLYANALFADYHVISMCPFAYFICLNHLNVFLYDQVNTSYLDFNRASHNRPDELFAFKKTLFCQFYNSTNEKLKKDIFYFKQITPANELELFVDLPDIRMKWLKKMVALE